MAVSQFNPTGVSFDGGVNWSALGAMRTIPGVANGYSPKPITGRVATSNGGATTVQAFTVTSGKTFYITDIYAALATSTSDIQIQVAGITVFWSYLNNAWPVAQSLTTPIVCPAGSAITIVFGTSGAGTPNAYFLLNGYEA